MKRRSSLYLCILAFIAICAGSAFSGSEALAASASISITSKTAKYYKGDMLYVVITVQSDTPIKSFQGTFSYDNSVLRYMTGGSIASGNDSEFYISDTDREKAVTSMKYSIKFYARKSKGTTIALKQPYIVAGEDGGEMSVSFNSLNLMIENERNDVASASPSKVTKKPKGKNTQKPENATGKETASPKTTKKPLPGKSPAPKPDVSPTKKAGGKKRPSGNNKSGSGKQSTVGITALRSGDSITLYSGEKYIVEKADDAEIPEGFGKAGCEFNGEMVDAYALESDTSHSYFLIYCKKNSEDEKAEFYLYDREEQTLMPYEKVQSWYRGIGEKSVVGERRDVDGRTEETLKYIIAVMVVFCVLMLIAVISVYLHFKGDRDEWNIG